MTQYVGAARVQTMLRDFERLRQAIRSGDIEAADKALDRCEPWFGCIDPARKRYDDPQPPRAGRNGPDTFY